MQALQGIKIHSALAQHPPLVPQFTGSHGRNLWMPSLPLRSARTCRSSRSLGSWNQTRQSKALPGSHAEQPRAGTPGQLGGTALAPRAHAARQGQGRSVWSRSRCATLCHWLGRSLRLCRPHLGLPGFTTEASYLKYTARLPKCVRDFFFFPCVFVFLLNSFPMPQVGRESEFLPNDTKWDLNTISPADVDMDM